MWPDHPHTDPGDGRTECERCGKYVWPITHSCKGIPVTARARTRRDADGTCSCEAYDCRGECCGPGNCTCSKPNGDSTNV